MSAGETHDASQVPSADEPFVPIESVEAIDAFIEWPDDKHIAHAFIGDEAYSPLLLTLSALAVIEDLRFLLVPDVPLPSFLKEHPLVSHEKVRRYELKDLGDIGSRTSGQRLRAWNHAGSMRGTLMTTEFCTFGNPARTLDALLDPKPDAILVMSGAHGFPTSEIIGYLISTMRSTSSRYPIYLADGPPGMIPSLWMIDALQAQLRDEALPQAYFWGYGAFWAHNIAHAPTDVVSCRRDLTLKTQRSREFCRELAGKLGLQETQKLPQGARLEPVDVARAASALHDAWVGALPRDIEIEITGKRPIDPSYLPTTGRESSEMQVDRFEGIVSQLSNCADSVNLTFGGHGDALSHPQLEEFISFARPHCAALTLRTFAVDLTYERFRRLADLGIDALNVRFGYWGKELYSDVNGRDAFDHIKELLERVRSESFEQASSVNRYETFLPLIVPEVRKGLRGDGSVLEFYSWACEHYMNPMVSNAKTWGGAIPMDQDMPLFPGVRKPCFRLQEQMQIFCDGNVPLCAVDFSARNPVANAFETPLRDIWRSPAFEQARKLHRSANYAEATPHCGSCNEWFRLD